MLTKCFALGPAVSKTAMSGSQDKYYPKIPPVVIAIYLPSVTEPICDTRIRFRVTPCRHVRRPCRKERQKDTCGRGFMASLAGFWGPGQSIPRVREKKKPRRTVYVLKEPSWTGRCGRVAAFSGRAVGHGAINTNRF